jgi:hypothetical protein
MAKITIAQLQTSDSYINELTATELDATKGGLLDGLATNLLRDGLDGLTANVLSVNVQNVNALNEGHSNAGNYND